MSRNTASNSAGANDGRPPVSASHPPASWLGGAAALVAMVAYPFLAYLAYASKQRHLALLLMGCTLLYVCVRALSGTRRIAGIAAVVGLCALAAFVPQGAVPFFLLPTLINLVLAGFFARTLAPGREALITRFARLGNQPMPSEVVTYTRRLTWVWTAFFAAMAVISGALLAVGAHAAWAWFTAVGSYLSIALLFGLEYVYRRHRFPDRPYVSPLRQLALVRAALRAK
ncbi:MAG: hypothetical protein WKH97_06000 [Casimicrobiaceae bacterium]